MFKLDYLYEQLKTKTVESQYVNILNAVTESCFDSTDIDHSILETMESIEEVSREGRLNVFDKLKTSVSSAEKILSKNKEAALKAKPIGLVYKGFNVFVSEEIIKARYKKALSYLNKFDPSKASESELKNYIKDSANNVQYKEISKIFGDGKERFSMNEIIVAKSSDKELTKTDISDAVKFLSTYSDKVKKLQKEQADNNKEYGDYVQKTGLITAKTNSDIGKLRKDAANHKRALIAIADQTYYVWMVQRMKKEANQAKQIVVKAANYNPRNLKESAIVQDYIDAMYDFYEE